MTDFNQITPNEMLKKLDEFNEANPEIKAFIDYLNSLDLPPHDQISMMANTMVGAIFARWLNGLW